MLKNFLTPLLVIFLAYTLAGCGKPAKIKGITPEQLKAMQERAKLSQKTSEEGKAKFKEKSERVFQENIGVLRSINPFLLTERKVAETSLTLGGIIWSQKGPTCIIGDAILGTGDSFRDKKVLKINRDNVILVDSRGNQITLRLDE